MRLLRSALPAVLSLAVLASCSSGGGDGATSATNQPDPMNATAEVRDPNADFGWDRTESDPAVLATLLEVARQVGGTPAGCVEPSETSVEAVKINFDIAHLPVPAATVQCLTVDEEDLTFEGFTDEQAKLIFLEAKQDLLCARAKQAATDPQTGKTTWTGIPYVDGGTWIIEPNTNETRDIVASGIGATAMNLCDNVGDRDNAAFPTF